MATMLIDAYDAAVVERRDDGKTSPRSAAGCWSHEAIERDAKSAS